MTAIITNGDDGDSGNITMTGRTRVLVSGDFGSSGYVEFEIEGDGLAKAVCNTVYIRTPEKRRNFIVDAANGDKLTATIVGGNGTTSLNVSATAL